MVLCFVEYWCNIVVVFTITDDDIFLSINLYNNDRYYFYIILTLFNESALGNLCTCCTLGEHLFEIKSDCKLWEVWFLDVHGWTLRNIFYHFNCDSETMICFFFLLYFCVEVELHIFIYKYTYIYIYIYIYMYICAYVYACIMSNYVFVYRCVWSMNSYKHWDLATQTRPTSTTWWLSHSEDRIHSCFVVYWYEFNIFLFWYLVYINVRKKCSILPTYNICLVNI